jgi:hypothetical protein
MSDFKEYIVTLKDYDDLNNFYFDMENITDKEYVPSREVEVAKRRTISRNTHYYLNQEEVNNLKNDSRVLSIELNNKDAGIKIVPSNTLITNIFETTDQWDKSSVIHINDVNWGLVASSSHTPSFIFPGWGDDGNSPSIQTAINFTNTGRNVDVIIADGIMPVGHPEYNSLDNPSNSRYIRHDWYQYNSVIGIPFGLPSPLNTSTYPYSYLEGPSGVIGNNDHGTHVAGTACGYLQGWAKNANIYNIYPYDAYLGYYLVDYIRAFHQNKPVNPKTGRKNPTIVNMSYTQVITVKINTIADIHYRNTVYNAPIGGYTSPMDFSIAGLPYFLSRLDYTTIALEPRSTHLDTDITDGIAEGIIFVAAAGNWNTYCDVPSGQDYNNYVTLNNSNKIYYHQGTSPSACPGVICVGAVESTVVAQKAFYSNYGPRVDVFAPGTNITSSYRSGGVQDERGNASQFIYKDTGTSMASPQVTGVIASILEIFPEMKQQDVRNYISKFSSVNQLTDQPFTSYNNQRSLNNSPNKYLYNKLERPLSGQVYPKYDYDPAYSNSTRPSFPRPLIRRFG